MMVLAKKFSIAVLVVTVISTVDCETDYAAELDKTRISDTSAPVTKSVGFTPACCPSVALAPVYIPSWRIGDGLSR